MKKMRMVVVLFLVLFSLAGCGKGTDSKEQTKTEDWPDTVDYAVHNIATDGKKVIYEKDQALQFMNLQSGESTVFCTQPNCSHKVLEDGSTSSCAALPPAGSNNLGTLGLHGDTVFECYDSEEMNQMVVYKAKVGSSGRRKFAVIPYGIEAMTPSYCIGDKMYLVGKQVNTHEDGSTDEEAMILALDLNTGKAEVLSQIHKHPESCSITAMNIQGDHLYYLYTCMKDGMDYDQFMKLSPEEAANAFSNTLYDLDYKTKEEREMSEIDLTKYDYLGQYDGNIYLKKDDKKIVTYNEQSKEEKEIVSVKGKEQIDYSTCYETGSMVFSVLSGEKEIFYYYDQKEQKETKLGEEPQHYTLLPNTIIGDSVLLQERETDGKGNYIYGDITMVPLSSYKDGTFTKGE